MSQYFSQYGEDRYLIPILPRKGVFIDVGAGDGRQFSNSLALERQGWTGLLIEPDPRRDLKWRKVKVVKNAVAREGGVVWFLQHENPDLSRISNLVGNIEVLARKLDDILEDNGITKIDLLSLDTEGTELEIWESFNYTKYQPEFVIIEWLTPDLPSREYETIFVFRACGYRLIHKTPVNLIFRSGIQTP